MFRYYIISLVWTLIILVLYSIPGSYLQYEEPLDFLKVDKLAHIGMFAIMVFLWMMAFRKQQKRIWLQQHARKTSLLLSILYGALLEYYQGAFFVDRTSDLFDFYANTIGAFLGIILYQILYNKELRKA